MPIPEADPDEPVETKPFKFVTGKWFLVTSITLERSIANSTVAGMCILSFRIGHFPVTLSFFWIIGKTRRVDRVGKLVAIGNWAGNWKMLILCPFLSRLRCPFSEPKPVCFFFFFFGFSLADADTVSSSLLQY